MSRQLSSLYLLFFSYYHNFMLHYREALGRCKECTMFDNCGFCVTSLQCLAGSINGPDDANIQCPSWNFADTTCPYVPECNEYSSCFDCASQDQCAWCASAEACFTVSEAFTQSCQGLVFEPPCPSSSIIGMSETHLINVVY